MKNNNEDMQMIKLLSSAEWQNTYKNFVYQNSTQFSENQANIEEQHNLYKKFQLALNPIAEKYITKEMQDKWKLNLKEILAQNPHENVVQILSLYDFKIFQAEMISQNQLLDLIALELIRQQAKKELNQDSSSDDEQAEIEYFEQERKRAKQNIEGIPNLEEEKINLEKSIRESIANFNLQELQVKQEVDTDQFGFNKGILEKEDDPFKKSIKLRALKFKQTLPKKEVKEIKITQEQIKQRRLQFNAIKNALKEI